MVYSLSLISISSCQFHQGNLFLTYQLSSPKRSFSSALDVRILICYCSLFIRDRLALGFQGSLLPLKSFVTILHFLCNFWESFLCLSHGCLKLLNLVVYHDLRSIFPFHLGLRFLNLTLFDLLGLCWWINELREIVLPLQKTVAKLLNWLLLSFQRLLLLLKHSLNFTHLYFFGLKLFDLLG